MSALAQKLADEWVQCEEPWACGKLVIHDDLPDPDENCEPFVCSACLLKPKVVVLIEKLQETDDSWYRRGAALADACEVADAALMLGNGHPSAQRDARLQVQRALERWRNSGIECSDAAAILNDLAPGTAEQIATRIIECFEAGQHRNDGSCALHPNRERWYIADAYRLAKMVLGETARRGWVCIRHRCTKHYDVPTQNTNEASGSECGGCIAAERDSLRAEVERLQSAARRDW